MMDAVFPRTGWLNFFDTHLGVWEENVDDEAMRAVFRALCGHLEARGWALAPCPRVQRQLEYSRNDSGMRKAARKRFEADFSARYRVGRKGDLEMETNVFGRHIELEFFQNVANVENPNGGKYDFGKFARMPRVIRTRYLVEVLSAIRFLQSVGYSLGKDLREPLPSTVLRICEGRAEEGLSPIEIYRRRRGSFYAHDQKDETGWPPASDFNAYGYPDRDGVRLRSGDVRYAYGHHGRLIRGAVFPALNGMWTVHAADCAVLAHVSSGELFSVAEGASLPPRRKPLGPAELVRRLKRELARAQEAADWKRVAMLAGALSRVSPPAEGRRAA